MEFEEHSKTLLRRHPERGSFDVNTAYEILDEALICHVAFESDGPVVIPTTFVRVKDQLYLHGAVASRMLRALDGAQLCVAVTLLDGLVFAKSAFHHSMNYRSVIIFGAGRVVVDIEEKERALNALVDHMAKGRSLETRMPSTKELESTQVIAIDLATVSTKIRKGPPADKKEDRELPYWSGVLPLALRPNEVEFGEGKIPKSVAKVLGHV